MNSKISVIVPVFNMERYLKRCIESIINQKHDNLEIILVNDGSTDSSKEICEQYTKNDKRIIVINKENGGLSDARNVGLDIATGDYIAFVDSDDYIHKDMYFVMFNVIKNRDYSIVECSYKDTYETLDSSFNNNTTLTPNEIVFEKKTAVINTMMDHKLRNFVWNKLYKKELWNNVRFPKGMLFEDVATTYKIVNLCRSVAKIDNVFYYYYQRNNSIVNSPFSLKQLDHCIALREGFDFIKKEYPDASLLYCVEFHKHYFIHLQRLIQNQNKIKEAKQVIRQLVEVMLLPENCSYYNKNKRLFNLCCEAILMDDFDRISAMRNVNKMRLSILKKSIWSVYVLNLFINWSKRTIKQVNKPFKMR